MSITIQQAGGDDDYRHHDPNKSFFEEVVVSEDSIVCPYCRAMVENPKGYKAGKLVCEKCRCTFFVRFQLRLYLMSRKAPWKQAPEVN